MKLKTWLITLTALITLITSCTHDAPSGITPAGVVPVTFAASVVGMQASSRTVNDVWTGDETIGVAAYSNVDGSMYTDGFRQYAPDDITGTGCSLVPVADEWRIDYPVNGGGLKFTAFSPWPSDEDVESGLATLSGSTVTYNLSKQSTDTDMAEKLDFIHFRGTDASTWLEPVATLNFRHKLSRVKINLSSSDTDIDLSKATATIGGVPTGVSANIESGVVTLTGSGSITAERVSAAARLTTFRVMLAPQTAGSTPSAVQRTITFTVNNKGYTILLPNDLEEGYTYTLNATYVDPEVVLDGVTIDGWEEEQLEPGTVAGEENCYIIPPGGQLFIPVRRAAMFATTAEGKAESAPILAPGETFYTKVYWTDNPAAIAAKGEGTASTQIYSIGSGPNGYILIRPGTGEGNAIVALQKKNSNGTYTTLWSWHIWVTDYTPSGQWMDRNLGATSSGPPQNDTDVSSLGLLYQWGRKDPFAGTTTLETRSGAEPDWLTMGVAGDTGSILYTVQHPTMFIKDRKRDVPNWQGEGGGKNITDPCPAGYQIPENDEWTFSGWMDTFDRYQHNANYGGYYPCAGIRMGDSGVLQCVGEEAIYPSQTYNGELYLHSGQISMKMELMNKSGHATSVRCRKINI